MFMMSSIFWDITPLSLLKVSRCFAEKIASIFDSEDGGHIFLRNVS
jgi:hypothetical protein